MRVARHHGPHRLVVVAYDLDRHLHPTTDPREQMEIVRRGTLQHSAQGGRVIHDSAEPVGQYVAPVQRLLEHVEMRLYVTATRQQIRSFTDNRGELTAAHLPRRLRLHARHVYSGMR